MRSKWAHGLALATVGVLASAAAANADLKLTTTFGGAQPTQGARTVPFFSDSFSFGGVAYPYTMVGTNPRTSRATTVEPTVIVPVRLVFADGSVADPGTSVENVLASPLFQSASFTSGRTQYGDAIRRAMFWRYDAHTNYHVLLAQPVVLPTQTIDVPKGQGAYVPAGTPVGMLNGTTIHTAVPMGDVSRTWFPAALNQLLNTLAVDPTTLPILLSRNVMESDGTIGFHTAYSLTSRATGPPNGNDPVQTAIWANYADPYVYAELPDITRNTDLLSHEISEWLHDPFISDLVPRWQSPLPIASLLYGCSSLLETGDPAIDVGFEVNGYQLQDEAFLSWFAHQVPSIGINAQYSYLGTFTTPPPIC